MSSIDLLVLVLKKLFRWFLRKSSSKLMVNAVEDDLLFSESLHAFMFVGESGLTRALGVDDPIELSNAAELALLKPDILFSCTANA